MSYTVQSGQTIYDVLLNTVGSWGALDEVLAQNSLTSYTPTLSAGDVINTDGIAIANNRTTIFAEQVPFAMGSYPDNFEADTASVLSVLETVFGG